MCNLCPFPNLHLSDEPMTGMLDTDSSESGDSPAMEGNGDGFLPDLPVLTHPAEWTMDQVSGENRQVCSGKSRNASERNHKDNALSSLL